MARAVGRCAPAVGREEGTGQARAGIHRALTGNDEATEQRGAAARGSSVGATAADGG
ncbi:hypothetical protein BLAT2472_50350 [Burkholderia latens]